MQYSISFLLRTTLFLGFWISDSWLFVPRQAEFQKVATVTTAEGDAQAASLLATAFQKAGDGLIELRKLEAAEDIAFQMSRSRNVSYLPPGQQTLLSLPMN